MPFKNELTTEDLDTLVGWGLWLYPMRIVRDSEGKKKSFFPTLDAEYKILGETAEWKGDKETPKGWYGTRQRIPNDVIIEFLNNGFDLCSVIDGNLIVVDCDDQDSYHAWLSIFANLGTNPIIKEKSLSNTPENCKHHIYFSLPSEEKAPYCSKFDCLQIFQNLEGGGEILGDHHLVYINKNGWDTPPSEYPKLPIVPESFLKRIDSPREKTKSASTINPSLFKSLKDFSNVDFRHYMRAMKNHGLNKSQTRKLLPIFREVVCTGQFYANDEHLNKIMDLFPSKYFSGFNKQVTSGNRHNEFLRFLSSLNLLGLNSNQMRPIAVKYCEITQIEPFSGERFNTDFNGYGYPIENQNGLFLTKEIESVIDDLEKNNEPSILDYVVMLSELEFEYVDGDFYRYNPNKGIWKKQKDDTVLKIVTDLVNGKAINPHPKLAENIIKHAQGTLGNADEKKMNTNKDVIVLQNGVFNINLMSLEKYDKKYYLTNQLPISYNPNATCPDWEKFLNEVLPDVLIQNVIQEFFGYCLTTDTSFHIALLLLGYGRNGKSTLGNMLAKLLGEHNVSHLEFSELNNENSLSMLENKQLNWGEEIKGGKIDDTSLFKKIVSGGITKVRNLYKDPREILPTAKFLFSGNVLPTTRDRSDGFMKRLMIIPFKVQFLDELGNINRNLEKELDLELDGIFIWALKGLSRLHANKKFTVSPVIKNMVREYEVEHNSVMLFIEENCTIDMNERTNSVFIYQQYKNWCLDNGYSPFNSRNFYSTLEVEYKLSRIKSGNIRYLNLKPISETFVSGFGQN